MANQFYKLLRDFLIETTEIMRRARKETNSLDILRK